MCPAVEMLIRRITVTELGPKGPNTQQSKTWDLGSNSICCTYRLWEYMIIAWVLNPRTSHDPQNPCRALRSFLQNKGRKSEAVYSPKIASSATIWVLVKELHSLTKAREPNWLRSSYDSSIQGP